MRLAALFAMMVALPACSSSRGSRAGAPAGTTPGAQAGGKGGDRGQGADGPGGPILVELYTSQGCSSCPPADVLLSLLGKDPQFAGQVIPLAFHVDYWNYIGWRDPFSTRAWTDRQNAYAQSFAERRIYTPQLVVNGEAHTVGSDRDASFQLMDQAAAHGRRARLTLTVAAGAGTVTAHLEVDNPDGPAVDLQVALAQNDVVTRVARGENEGKTLRNDHIVRRLVNAGRVAAGASAHFDVPLTVDATWGAGPLHVVAFAQDPSTLRVHGVTSADTRR